MGRNSNKKVGAALRAVRPTDTGCLSVDIHAHAHILNTKTAYRTLNVNSTASGETAATSPFTALSVTGCLTIQPTWRSHNMC